MNKINVSAPGKLMLLGEHSVVYGKACLVTSVDRRINLSINLNETGNFFLYAPDVNLNNYIKPINELGNGKILKEAKFVEFALKNTLEFIDKNLKKNINVKGITIETFSEFSYSFGFGSSSAVTVCVVKALSELFSLNLDKTEIFKISYKTILDVQGSGSGFDVASAVFGGTIFFKNKGEIINKLDINSLSLVVGYSGIKADTSTLIKQVKKNYEETKELTNEIFSKIEELVFEAKIAILNSDYLKLGELMNSNQKLLNKLDVSTPKLDFMINEALKNGAFGAKLSGAGGGDCMIALVKEENKNEVESGIIKAGGTIIPIKTNAQGVRIDL